MDLRKVKKLIELLEESELTEMEITEGESTIRLSRGSNAVSAPQQYLPPMVGNFEAQSSVKPSVAEPAGSHIDAHSAPSGNAITSPMVGTFYDAPSPDTAPYIEIGSAVKQGDVLCIIEAMKTFNQLEAEVSGTVKAIYKSSGDPVEFGEPLFLID